MRAPRLERLAQTLVDHSAKVCPGDVMLVSGGLDCQPLLTAIFALALARGVRPILRLRPDLCLDRVVAIGDNDLGLYRNPLHVADGESIRSSIGIWNAAQHDLGPPAHVTFAESDECHAQTEFLRAAAGGEVTWVATVFPTPAAAQRLGLSASRLEHLVACAGFLDHPDPATAWRKIETLQQEFCDRLAHAREVRIRAANGTDLICQVAGRHWRNGAGQTNLPDGEVNTAPHFAGTSGVFAPNLPVWQAGQQIAGVRLLIRDGKVVDASAEIGQNALWNLLSRDPGASRLGELGIGLNFGLRDATGCSLLDEKLGGSIHIALGAAFPESGGPPTGEVNVSMIHRDLILDLRPGGSICVDGQPLNEGGKFIASDWPHPETWDWPVAAG